MAKRAKGAAPAPNGKPVTVRVQRSQKQRDAARVNGTKSRGPKTPQGKAISAMNALKEGIYAASLPPHADDRGEDAIYRNLIVEITEQYPPRDLLEKYLAQNIAYAMIIQRRLRRANELKMMPKKGPAIPQAEVQKLARRKIALERATLISECYDRIAKGSLPGLEAEAAASLAEHYHAAVVDSAKANAEAERRARQAAGEEDQEDQEDGEDGTDEAIKFDPDTAAEVVRRRLEDERRSLESYIPEPAELEPPGTQKKVDQKEEQWEDVELLAGLTLYQATRSVAKEFVTLERVAKSLGQTTRLSRQRKIAWLEVLRCIYFYRPHVDTIDSSTSRERVSPQELADATLSELLNDLDGFSKLQRQDRELDRRIQKGLRQLSRSR